MPRWPRRRRDRGRGGGGRGHGPLIPDPVPHFWNTPETPEAESSGLGQVSHPPGLRGREIGMFYRNLQKRHRKKERALRLIIPPAVVRQVRLHLLSIGKIVIQNGITIPNAYVSKFIKQKPILISDEDIKYEIKLEPEGATTEGGNEPIFKIPSVPVKLEPSPSTSANMDQTSDSDNNSEEETNFVPFNMQLGASKSSDFISTSQEELLKCGNLNDDRRQRIPNAYVSKFIKQKPILISDEGIKCEIKLEPEGATTDGGNEPIFKIPSVPVKLEPSPSTSANMDQTSDSDNNSEEETNRRIFVPFNMQLGASKSSDFISTSQEELLKCGNLNDDRRQLSLRDGSHYKYSYADIITGSFNEKLDECLAKGITINIKNNPDIKDLNEGFALEYEDMIQRAEYKMMKEFRVKLPAYKKRQELLHVINNSSVIVISGETGCGKSTQVPQIILDDAIMNRRGANTKILVTQPRRIAASSLSERVAAERAEGNGNSVGYAVRLEKVEARPRGSIMFCTTGILLNELEVNQGLNNVSHVILDEVHERDVHVDLVMVMLKQVLKKRKDLKLILMSATLDAQSLSAYYDYCPTIHIEGLAYPVQDIYLEEILRLTQFDPNTLPGTNSKRDKAMAMEKDIRHKADVGPWLQSIRRDMEPSVYRGLLDWRLEQLQVGLIFQVLAYICKGKPGAVLIFVPGISEITKILTHIYESGNYPSSQYEVYPLHSKLPSLEQKRIFERPREGVRKIIVATNIAETSITIDDIVYVIDCGKIKMSGLNVKDNVATLKTEWVSQANLRQRRGRAGRCQPGVCYHMLTSYRASKLAERLLPELQRSNLLEPVLMLKKLRMGMAAEALKMVPDPPADSTVKWAVKQLQQVGALDPNETLTALGWHIARLPVHPAAGKLLLLGALFGCLDRAASVAAVWGFKDPFMLVIGKEKERDRAKLELTGGEPSDHVAMSEAIIGWERAGREQHAFAFQYFLSNNTLKLLSQMKHQFGDNLKQMGFLTSGDIKSTWENRNAHNISLFKAIVAASLYPNIGVVKWNGLRSRNPRRRITITVKTPEEGVVNIHPSSVMVNTFSKSGFANRPICNMGANWLVYWLKQKSTALYLIDVTLVYTLPLLFFGELMVSDEPVVAAPDHCHMLLSTYMVRCHRDTADMLFELRSLLDHVLASKVTVGDHSLRHCDFEEQVLNAVIDLITAEDEQAAYDDSDSDQSEYEGNQSQRMKWNPKYK